MDEIENIISSEVTQTKRNTHGMCSLISGYCPKFHNVHNTTHRPYESYKEGRPGYGCFSPALSVEHDDPGRGK